MRSLWFCFGEGFSRSGEGELEGADAGAVDVGFLAAGETPHPQSHFSRAQPIWATHRGHEEGASLLELEPANVILRPSGYAVRGRLLPSTVSCLLVAVLPPASIGALRVTHCYDMR